MCSKAEMLKDLCASNSKGKAQKIGVVFKVSSHQRICLRRWNKGVSGKALALGCGATAASSPMEVSHHLSCSLHGALTWTLSS